MNLGRGGGGGLNATLCPSPGVGYSARGLGSKFGGGGWDSEDGFDEKVVHPPERTPQGES